MELRAKTVIIDLKFPLPYGHSRYAKGMVNERGANRLFPAHGFSAIASISPVCGALRGEDVEGLPAFWTKAKYGKMSIEGRDSVNTETPHYSKAGAVDDRKILVTPRNANIPGNLQVRQSDRFD